MRSLREQMQLDVDNVILAEGGLAEDVIYTPAGQAARTIRAKIDRNPFRLEFDGDGEGTKKRYKIDISASATTGVETPAIKDKVTVDGANWAVVEIDPAGPGEMHSVTIERFGRQTVAKRSLRRVR